MIGSVNSVQSQLSKVQEAQMNLATTGVNQSQQPQQNVNKSESNRKVESSSYEPTEKTEEPQALMDKLSQIENQYLATNSLYSQTNQQVNQVNGLQAYQQAGKSEFSFA